MSPQPLLCRRPMLPGESLPSFIARLAKMNNYEPRSILESMIRGSWKYGRKARGSYLSARLGYLSLASQFTWLGALTNIEPYKLYRATAHCFSSILTPSENEITSIELSNGQSVPILPRNIARRHVRPEYASQFCPLCLKDTAYHRLIWYPMASSACQDHKCLLVSSCPGCEKAVRIPDIIETRCSNCKTNYTAVEPISIKIDSFGLFTQSLIQTWLTEGISPTSPNYPLPQQMPRDLYRVVDGLRLSIMHVNHDWPLLHNINNAPHSLGVGTAEMRSAYSQTLTAYQNYCLYATACKGIINWPMGFHRFLTVYYNSENTGQVHYSTNSLPKKLGVLYTWISRRWKQPSLEFVQQAFYEYLADNHLLFPALSKSRYRNMPELISKLHYVYLNEAVKLLGTSEKRLRLMIRSGRLTSYNEMDKSRFILVKREDVLELRKRWEQALDLKEAANWLGLSRELVPQLVKVGLLAAQQTTAEGLSWMFSPSDVTECLERVTERVGSYSSLEIVNNEEMLSLKRTSSLLRNKLGLGSLALALQKVADGDLPAYILANSKLQLRSLIFARSDIDAYIEAEKAEQGWIDREEVASILGITRQSLISWVKTGLISPATTEGLKYYFNRQEIEKLKSDLMLTTEAFETLGISRWALYSLVQQGRLNALRGPAVDGYRPYVFSRESLLEWRQNRLTLHEAQHQLEISNTELVSWVKQGKLLPIEDKTLHPWYFSRQHISSIGERTRPGQP